MRCATPRSRSRYLSTSTTGATRSSSRSPTTGAAPQGRRRSGHSRACTRCGKGFRCTAVQSRPALVPRTDGPSTSPCRSQARKLVDETSVLLVDDQALVREGIAMVLGREPGLRVVAEADDGRAGVELARRHRPDVVLMDVRMPVMDGSEATREIVTECPETRVLVLAAFDLDEHALRALRAGASGFLLKDVRSADLVEAIRTVAAGDAVVSPRITRR